MALKMIPIVATVAELVAKLADMPPDSIVTVYDTEFGACCIQDVVLDKETNVVELK
jgi:hypothetical protein